MRSCLAVVAMFLVFLVGACAQREPQRGEFFMDTLLAFDTATINSGRVQVDIQATTSAGLKKLYPAGDLASEAEHFGYKFVGGDRIVGACTGGQAGYSRADDGGFTIRMLSITFDADCNVTSVEIALGKMGL